LVADALILLDLGFCDFWLFDHIDQNDGWFVFRVKDKANFEIVEELRTWKGNSIPLVGESLQAVLDDPHRQEINVRITLSSDRIRGLERQLNPDVSISRFPMISLKSTISI